MEKEPIIIKFLGKRYTLRVQGWIASYSWQGGNSQGDYNASKSWWEGLARLSTEQGEVVFAFETRKYRDSGPSTLAKDFLVIVGISALAEIPDLKEVVDPFCEKLWKLVKEKEAKEDALPVVTIDTLPYIDGEEFIQQGFIIEPGRQLEFSIGK